VENPIQMEDLKGCPHFEETRKCSWKMILAKLRGLGENFLECTFLNVSFNSPATQRVACSQRFSQGDGCVISTTPKTSKSSLEKICSKHFKTVVKTISNW